MTLRHWLSESLIPVIASIRAVAAFAWATGATVNEQIKHCQKGSSELEG